MSLAGRKVEINGIHYHVSDQGQSDRAVILLHGMPDTSSMWRYQVEALLKAGFRVIAPDLLGYGETDKPQEVERYRGDLILADVIEMVEGLDAKQLDVVGHDWGSALSWELVSHRPDLFRRHVTLEVGHLGLFYADVDIPKVKENWYMYINSQPTAPELYVLNNCEFFCDIIIPTHPELDEVRSRLKTVEAMRGCLNWDRANPVSEGFRAIKTGEYSYPKCTVPTMGIWTPGDTYLFEEYMLRTPEYMDAEWRYERIETGAHWIMLDEPEKVNRLILDWLDRN
jgi:pimeloyl-ACP methyl ester carboxylesterase